MGTLKSLYRKQEQIRQLRSQLSKLEEEFKQLCQSCVEKNHLKEGKYQLLVKFRNVRKIKDARQFLSHVGELGWSCMSVSVQKADALKLAIPQDLVEVHTTPTYQITITS